MDSQYAGRRDPPSAIFSSLRSRIRTVHIAVSILVVQTRCSHQSLGSRAQTATNWRTSLPDSIIGSQEASMPIK